MRICREVWRKFSCHYTCSPVFTFLCLVYVTSLRWGQFIFISNDRPSEYTPILTHSIINLSQLLLESFFQDVITWPEFNFNGWKTSWSVWCFLVAFWELFKASLTFSKWREERGLYSVRWRCHCLSSITQWSWTPEVSLRAYEDWPICMLFISRFICFDRWTWLMLNSMMNSISW